MTSKIPKVIRDEPCYVCGNATKFCRSVKGSFFWFCPSCEAEGCLHPPGEDCFHRRAVGGKVIKSNTNISSDESDDILTNMI